MIEMPELWELIALFECEPVLADEGVPLSYNMLNFTSTRGADELCCQISPGYGDVHFKWTRQSLKRIDLNLHSVHRLAVFLGSWEGLEITFDDRRRMEMLRLQLKPEITIEMGMKIWD